MKCPRCKQSNAKKEKNCVQCFLPLNSHVLSTFAKNIEMQRKRIENNEDDLLIYCDKKMRVYPKSVADEGKYSKRIVYYKNHRFVLLDFFNVIWNKRAVIHFKLRPDKGLILYYLRDHPKNAFFAEVLEYLATILDWELTDLTKIFDHDININKQFEKVKK